MQDNRWFVLLEGHDFDLEALAEFLAVGPIAIVRRDDGRWYLSGGVFAGLTDASAVKERAVEVVEILNGAGAVFAFETIVIGSTIGELTEAGQLRNHVLLEGTVVARGRVRAKLSGPDGKPMPDQRGSLFRCIVNLAQTDARVWSALHFLGTQQSWANLYKVLEIVKDDVGQQVYDLVDKAKLRAFAGTAQSRRLLGDQARHASDRYTGPREPLSLAEAKELVRQLVHSWIRRRHVPEDGAGLTT